MNQRMSGCIRDCREGAAAHSLSKMLARRVYGICLGWEDCNDFDTLRADPLYRLVLGGEVASQPTQSRFENASRVTETCSG